MPFFGPTGTQLKQYSEAFKVTLVPFCGPTEGLRLKCRQFYVPIFAGHHKH